MRTRDVKSGYAVQEYAGRARTEVGVLYPVCPNPKRLLSFTDVRRWIYSVHVVCPCCDAPAVPQIPRTEYPIVSVRRLQCECLKCGIHFVTWPNGELSHATGTGLYFIECLGFVKIGITGDAPARLRLLVGSTPHEIKPIGFIQIFGDSRPEERRLHQMFMHLHHRDEWFRDAPELREWIAANTKRPEPFFRSGRRWNHAPKA